MSTKKLVTVSTAGLIVLLFCLSAYASTASDVATNVLTRLVQVLGTVLGMLLTSLVWKALQKLKVSVTADQQNLVDNAVYQGIGWAEEWANKLATQAGGKAPSSQEKLAQAVQFVTTVIDEYGLEQKGVAWIEARIHAMLGMSTLTGGVAVPVAPPMAPLVNPPVAN